MAATYDTVVIGGGTAGAAVAGRLAARGDGSVLLLEAGPDYGARDAGGWPADLLDARILTTSHDWGFASAARTGIPDHALPRARVIGGCSSHNGCIALWGHRLDYDGWSAMGNLGWSAEEMLPFFRRANEMLRVRNFSEQEVTPFHAGCLEAMAMAGIPATEGLNDVNESIGSAVAPVNIQDGVRWNTAMAYLDPVRESPQLTVMGDALVDRIHLEANRAVSVEIVHGGTTQRINTGRIILSAGAYGSPAILMRSGIGEAGALEKLGIQVMINLAGVGKNLHDHPAIELQYRGSETLSSRMAAFAAAGHPIFTEQSLAKARSGHCEEAFDIHVYPASSSRPDDEGRWTLTFPVANMAPRSRGHVWLRSADAAANPVIDTAYLTDRDEVDVAVLMDGIALARRITSSGALACLLEQELPESAVVIDRATARSACVHYYHPVGTCKMGPASDTTAVVDASGTVHGCENLTVADASVMPTIPRANTNLPTLALAEKIVAGLG